MRFQVVLTVIIAVLQLLDTYSTYRVLTVPPISVGANQVQIGVEGNPWLRSLQKRIMKLPYGGPWLWLIVAKIWVLILLATGWYWSWWQSDVGVWMLFLLACWYTWVARNNISVWAQLGK